MKYRIDRVYRRASGNPRYVGYCPGGYEYEVVRLCDEATVATCATRRDALAAVTRLQGVAP